MPERLAVKLEKWHGHAKLFYSKVSLVPDFCFNYGLMFIQVIITELRWFFHRSQDLLPAVLDSDTVIISLTSHQPRFKYLRRTLICLLMQNYKNFRIVLNLAEQDYAVLPQRISLLSKYGVEINTSNADLKVYLKLVPTLQSFPANRIVTVDDDIFYNRDWLLTLIQSSRNFPDSIIGFRALQVPSNWPCEAYSSWKSPSSDCTSKVEVLLTGVAGILYPPGIFTEHFALLQDLAELAPLADDLSYYWLATMLGIERQYLTSRYSNPKSWNGSQRIALWKTNVALGQNDIQFALLRNFVMKNEM